MGISVSVGNCDPAENRRFFVDQTCDYDIRIENISTIHWDLSARNLLRSPFSFLTKSSCGIVPAKRKSSLPGVTDFFRLWAT